METDFEAYRGSFARLLNDVAERRAVTLGKAETLLKVLQLRGFAVPEARRQQVLACRDRDQLDLWIERAADGHDLDDIFA